MFTVLQIRQKWNQIKPNFEVGNIVLVHDSVIKSKWPMARILKTYTYEEGIVQSIQLVTLRTNSSD